MDKKTLIIILVLIAGLSGLYYFMTGEIPLKEYIIDEEVSSDVDQQTQSLSEQSEPDSLSSIEKDATTTDLEDLDAELIDIEEELNQL